MPSSIRSTRALLAAFAALSGFLSFSNAQSVATTPVGAMTYSLAATSQPTTTHHSLPLQSDPVYAGPISAVSATSLTFSGTPFTSGSLAVAGSPFFLRIKSGAQAGRTILVTANTTNSVTLDTTDNSSQTTALDTSGFAVVVGDSVELIPGDTLASLFGTGGSLILTGGTSAFNADTVGIFNKATSKFDQYYYNSSSNIWRTQASAVNRNNLVLYPESGFSIGRPASRPAISFTVLGVVPTVKPLLKTVGNNTLVNVGTGYPANVTIGSLAYAGWKKANSSLSADTINVWNAVTGKFDIYFQRLDNSLWNKVGAPAATDQAGVVIPAGIAVKIERKNPLSGTASYMSSNLPYTL